MRILCRRPLHWSPQHSLSFVGAGDEIPSQCMVVLCLCPTAQVELRVEMQLMEHRNLLESVFCLGLVDFTNTFFAFHQLRALYSMYLRKTKSLNKLLYHLFRLMPENPTYGETAIEVSNKDPKTFFTEELQLSIRGQWSTCVYLS